MKKCLGGLIVMSFIAFPAFSQSVRDFAVRANMIDGMSGITIVGYFGKEKSIIIPPNIDGLPVTSIGEQAFMMRGLTHVVIPDSVLIIGRQAFFGNQLKNIYLPPSVRTIGDSAFDNNQFINVRRGVGRASTAPRVEKPIPRSRSEAALPKPAEPNRVTILEKAPMHPAPLPPPPPPPAPKPQEVYTNLPPVAEVIINEPKDTTEIIYEVAPPQDVLEPQAVFVEKESENPHQFIYVEKPAYEPRQIVIFEQGNNGSGIKHSVFVEQRGMPTQPPPSPIQSEKPRMPPFESAIEEPALEIITVEKYQTMPPMSPRPDEYEYEEEKRKKARFPRRPGENTGSETNTRKSPDTDRVPSENRWLLQETERDTTVYIQDRGSVGRTSAQVLPTMPKPPVDEGTFFLQNNGDGTATVVGYRGQYNFVSIPRKIGALTLSRIANSAFYQHRLVRVYIPDTVIHIADGAFAGNSIQDVNIPESVRYIGYQAFSGNDLMRVTVGTNVNIQPDSFRNNFVEYYNVHGKLGGTYVWHEGNWSYTNLNDVQYVYDEY
ncbi:MAG: leucine-rich repeat domain-containing protein [Spirochaetaceae bacterium]|jgi:hypothetical protein|nr:leucine-rich repeat domain-containing protein [Spirochaetaceae bacterium]